MLWILLFLCASALAADDVAVDPKVLTVPEEVQQIANLEMEIEGSLRDDKFNKSIQLDIQESIDRMEKLIKDAEEIDENSPESCRKHDLLVMKGARQPNRRPPKVQDSTDPKSYVVYEKHDTDEWARLPRSQRKEITQVWATDLPVIWKRRLEAYYRSVNASETDTPKKVKK